MSSAGPSRPRVVTLTADQLLGTSLTPARAHNKHKNSNTPRVLTIEDLLGPGLTVARPASRPTPTRTAPRPTPRPSSSRGSGSSSTRTAPNPRLVRVTADEVLRTGIPVRTLQAVKARSQVLSAEELLAATSSRSSVRTPPQARGRTTAAQLSGGSSSPGGSGSRSAAGVGAGRTAGNASTAGSHETRQTAQQAGRDNGASGSSTQGRNPRSGPPRRSLSLGSMRTLPIYTQEPGDSETVIDRGATELEDDDDIPITVMSPVDETEPNADSSASAGPTSSSPGSPSETEGATLSRQLSPVDASTSVASSLPNDLTPLPPWTSIYHDAAPSYEAAMSTPNLHVYRERPEDVPPLPTSPSRGPASPVSPATDAHPTNTNIVSAAGSPALTGSPNLNTNPVSAASSPGPTFPRPTVRVVTPQVPAIPRTSPGARSPASPSSPPGERADGAETPRRRFGFMSTLFHSRSSSRLRSRSHSHSSTQAPSPGRVASPELLAPRPTRAFHRVSQSASGSMLDLTSRSRADN